PPLPVNRHSSLHDSRSTATRPPLLPIDRHSSFRLFGSTATPTTPTPTFGTPTYAGGRGGVPRGETVKRSAGVQGAASPLLGVWGQSPRDPQHRWIVIPPQDFRCRSACEDREMRPASTPSLKPRLWVNKASSASGRERCERTATPRIRPAGQACGRPAPVASPPSLYPSLPPHALTGRLQWPYARWGCGLRAPSASRRRPGGQSH